MLKQKKIDSLIFNYLLSIKEFNKIVTSIAEEIKKCNDDSIIPMCIEDLETLERYRELFLSSNIQIDKHVSELFDYIETECISKGFIKTSKRFDYHFFEYNRLEDYYEIMMMDAKPYIYPQRYNEACESAIHKDYFNVSVYAQALIMLGCNASFDTVLSYIKVNAAKEHYNLILNEIANYSIVGVNFFKYVIDSQNITLTEEQNIELKMLELSNECMTKDMNNSPQYKYRTILDPSGKYIKCDIKPFEEMDFDGYYTRANDFIKTEREYLEAETSRFDLPTVLNVKYDCQALIVISNDKMYALRTAVDYKETLLRLLGFIGLTKMLPLPDEREEDKDYEKYINECVNRGISIIKIKKIGSNIDIIYHLPIEKHFNYKRELSRFFLSLNKYEAIKSRKTKKKHHVKSTLIIRNKKIENLPK